MQPQDFCYWLKGYFEMQEVEHGDISVTPQAAEAIYDHLKLVFNKVTPVRTPGHFNGIGIGIDQPLIAC